MDGVRTSTYNLFGAKYIFKKLEPLTCYDLLIERKDGYITFACKKEEEETYEQVQFEANYPLFSSTNGNMRISNAVGASIDLKYFSITVDGKEVFNGLKDLTQYDTYTLPSSEVITIPYIPSVDGVKIVDVAYKPLVDQLYTETGMGNYIIIDETNKTFRLPLPDIYSQIENKTSFTLRKWED